MESIKPLDSLNPLDGFNKACIEYQLDKSTNTPVKLFPSFKEWCDILESPHYENTDCYFADEDLAKQLDIYDALEVFRINGLLDRGTVLENVYKGNNNVSKLTIVLEPNKQGVYIGTCYNGGFSVLGKMMYKKSTKIPNGLEIYKVVVHSTRFEEGLATAIYQSTLNAGYILISDSYQYKGAKRLWKSFYNVDSQTPLWRYMVNDKEISVKVYNMYAGEYIGDAKELSDSDIWSQGDEPQKTHIRLVAELIDNL